MFFKKREAVDIRDLHKSTSSNKGFVPISGTGYVDFTTRKKLPSEILKEKDNIKTSERASAIISSISSSDASPAFSFFDNPSFNEDKSSNSDEAIRKVSMQLSDLDTKLYKLEQRIEVIERKVGVGDSSNSGFSW